MNRIEENAKLLQKIMEQIKENNSCCYEEFQLFQLGFYSFTSGRYLKEFGHIGG